MQIEYRTAQPADAPGIEALIPISARGLQSSDYDAEQIEGALGSVFAVDGQLIRDGTYFVALAGARLVGCGGWSKRRRAYGGNSPTGGEDPLRDPASEPAMIRAFFVHPEFSRRGIGREILRRSETAARKAGFHRIEIVATLPGARLYAACGYAVVERFDIKLRNGRSLPVVRMKRS